MIIQSNFANVIISGETEIEFVNQYNHIWVENLGSEDIKMSREPDIEGRTDGVIVRPAGSSGGCAVGNPAKIYVSGSGSINVAGTNSAENPFKSASKGGDGSGSGSKYLIVTELPEVGDSKYVYLVPVEDYYADNRYNEYAWIDDKWEMLGTPIIDVITSYDDLTDKPSINNVALTGNKSLADLGISSFDKRYSSLTGAPTKYASSSNLNFYNSAWVRIMTINKLPATGSMLLNLVYCNEHFTSVSVSSSTPIGSLVAMVSWLITGGNVFLDFKILSKYVDDGVLIKTRFDATKYNDAYPIHIDVRFENVGQWRNLLHVNATLLNPVLYKLTTISFPFTIDPSVRTGWDYVTKTFDNVVNDVTVDSALSTTSINAIQNKVVTEALNTKLNADDIATDTHIGGVKSGGDITVASDGTVGVNVTQTSLKIIKYIGDFVGKTVAEVKELILDEFKQIPNNTFTCFYYDGNGLVNHWNEPNYVLEAGSTHQLTSIGGNVRFDQSVYAKVLLTSHNTSKLHTIKIAGNEMRLIEILTSDSITSEMLTELQNVDDKEEIINADLGQNQDP